MVRSAADASTGAFPARRRRRIRNSGARATTAGALPEKPKRNPEQARAAETILTAGRESREAFLGRHAEAVYRALTKNLTNFVRAEELVYEAAKLVPGLMPTRAAGRRQSEKLQRDKDGIEVDQGIFLRTVLAHPDRRHASLPRDAAAEAGVARAR